MLSFVVIVVVVNKVAEICFGMGFFLPLVFKLPPALVMIAVVAVLELAELFAPSPRQRLPGRNSLDKGRGSAKAG